MNRKIARCAYAAKTRRQPAPPPARNFNGETDRTKREPPRGKHATTAKWRMARLHANDPESKKTLCPAALGSVQGRIMH